MEISLIVVATIVLILIWKFTDQKKADRTPVRKAAPLYPQAVKKMWIIPLKNFVIFLLSKQVEIVRPLW